MQQSESTSTEHNLQPTRAPKPDERDAVVAMLDQVFRIAQGKEPSIGSDWAHVYLPENLGNIHTVFDTGFENGTVETSKPVASAGLWISDVKLGQTSLRVGGINCVGTLPEYRKHGLGAQVMDAAKQTMHAQGCAVGMLGTGIANWYRRMGWEWAGSTRHYTLNRGNVALLPAMRAGVTLRIVNLAVEGMDALDERILALYHQANWGRPRTVELFRQLATARKVQQLVVAEEAGEAIAYLLAQDNHVVEWASRGASHVDINYSGQNQQAFTDVMTLVRAYFEAIDDPSASASLRASDSGGAALLRTMILHTPNHSAIQHPLVNLLDAIAIPYSVEYLGMLYLVNPQAVLDAFGLSDQVQITPIHQKSTTNQSPDWFLVQTPQASIELGRSALTKLFFGPERIMNNAYQPIGQAFFPLPLWQWRIERV